MTPYSTRPGEQVAWRLPRRIVTTIAALFPAAGLTVATAGPIDTTGSKVIRDDVRTARRRDSAGRRPADPRRPQLVDVKVGTESGSRLVGIFESELPPGGGFPFAHVHDEYEEIFHVLDGEIEYRVGDK